MRLQSCAECKGLYQHYRQGEVDLDCETVLLFHRLENLIKLTCNTLRQQITNTEQRRLENEIKEVLDDWSSNSEKKKELLSGKRVELAEQIKQVTVRHCSRKDYCSRRSGCVLTCISIKNMVLSSYIYQK